MEDAPEEVLGLMGVEEGTMMRVDEGTPVLDECSPEYGLWIMGEQRWQRTGLLAAEEDPSWVDEVCGVGGGQEVVEERREGGGEARESLQARIDRELASGGELGGSLERVSEQEVSREGERTACMREPENAEEVIKWMVKRLMENEGVGEAELKKRTVEQFGREKLPDHFHWIVVGMKEGLRRGREAGQQRKRMRKRDIRVQTERVDGCGVSVQTDLTGIDVGKMEKRAYESIRASRKKSKAGSGLGSENLEVTIVAEKLENEIEVIMDRDEDMPILVELEDLCEKGEIGDDLLTGWELPEVGNPDGCSSPF